MYAYRIIKMAKEKAIVIDKLDIKKSTPLFPETGAMTFPNTASWGWGSLNGG